MSLDFITDLYFNVQVVSKTFVSDVYLSRYLDSDYYYTIFIDAWKKPQISPGTYIIY